ncbi:MAG: cbb3-type cytochrome oxidase assembly protein CcoS [Bacteroidetes bacterium]|nr:cbb3-type cytochrome oxidase assembly protein CcoS [Bacteroidota bacterium]
MSVLFLLIIISLSVAAFFVGCYYWAIKTDQFEDDYTPSVRILFDDEIVGNKKSFSTIRPDESSILISDQLTKKPRE